MLWRADLFPVHQTFSTTHFFLGVPKKTPSKLANFLDEPLVSKKQSGDILR
jgi:hypothetical protein